MAVSGSPTRPRSFRSGPFDYHEVVELTIQTLTNQGHGLARVPLPAGDGAPMEIPAEPAARPGGWVVMVPFALPGERVRARIYRNQKNFSEADLVEVLEPSPMRVHPRCPLFGKCGGCQYQHLAYPEQLEWKRRQVAELLRHMAGLDHAVEAVIASPREYAYRAKITPHFHRPPKGAPADAPIAIGFLEEGNRSRLVDVPQCPIATDPVNARLATLRGEVREWAPRAKAGATLLLREQHDGTVLTDPRAVAVERVGSLTLEHLAGDFFQNNAFILPSFVGHAVEQAAGAGEKRARFLVDAYCGSGLFALAAARRFERVAGVEISASAVERATRNAALNGIHNAGFLAASAEAIFSGIDFPAGESAVIVDPPRAGCSEDFLNQLVTWRPARIVYVSCNPATQMRDLRLLTAAGYTVGTVQPFDLFPQTKHLECVITLEAAPSPPSR